MPTPAETEFYMHRERQERALADRTHNSDGRRVHLDMAGRYAEADLVICRAGALTVSELSAAGMASVLVPFPYAVDDHQTANAKFLADSGAAMLIRQSEMDPVKLAGLIRTLDRAKLLAMAEKARALGKPEATRLVAESCIRLSGGVPA